MGHGWTGDKWWIRKYPCYSCVFTYHLHVSTLCTCSFPLMRINVIYVCLHVHMICLFQLPPSPVPGLQANTIIQSLLAYFLFWLGCVNLIQTLSGKKELQWENAYIVPPVGMSVGHFLSDWIGKAHVIVCSATPGPMVLGCRWKQT